MFNSVFRNGGQVLAAFTDIPQNINTYGDIKNVFDGRDERLTFEFRSKAQIRISARSYIQNYSLLTSIILGSRSVTDKDALSRSQSAAKNSRHDSDSDQDVSFQLFHLVTF